MTMAALQQKIDFVTLLTVKKANINGDPLNGNRPREDYDGYGIFSDVAIKRKIRNRLQDENQAIFVQSNGRETDNYRSLEERAKSDPDLDAELKKGKKADADKFIQIACKKWIDVRAFGQVFAFKKKNGVADALSVGVRGPVTIQQAVSVEPIRIVDMPIVRSVNGEDGAEGKASDTMGMKHFVDFGLYVIRGSINCQLAEKTGFSYEDAQLIKKALCTLFENDESSARPAGSCVVCRVYWWEHTEKTPKETSAKILNSLKFIPKVENPQSFYDYEIPKPDTDCEPEIIDLC